MAIEAETYIEYYLKPLQPWLERADVSDIFINRPGEVWVETIGGITERHTQELFNSQWLWRLGRLLAHQSHQGLSPQHPLLACALPGGARIQIIASPASRAEMSIAIRKPSQQIIPLPDFCRSDTVRGNQNPIIQPKKTDYFRFLTEAVKSRMTIVISGGTSSGKTTLLNTLIQSIPPEERLLYIEDTPELKMPDRNCAGFISVRGHQGEADVSTDNILTAALRMKPDRIILGELRGAEALTFIRAASTGHPGSMTTIHADNPSRALSQLAMLALEAKSGASFEELYDQLVSVVDVVVQMGPRTGNRVIEQIEVTRRAM